MERILNLVHKVKGEMARIDDFLLIGNRIKHIRKSLGMNQDDFSAALGIGKATLLRYEKGHRDVPYSILVDVIRLGNAVNPTWLLLGEGVEPTPPLALDDPSLEGLGRVALVFAMYPEARKRIVDNARRLAKAIEDERREGGSNQHPPLYQ